MPKVIRPTEDTQLQPLPEVEEVVVEEEETEKEESKEEDEPKDLSVEALDADQPLWNDGPTAAQAVGWKEKYGDVYVTSVTSDYHVAWRTINRGEFKMVVKQIEQIVSGGNVSQAEAEMINEELVCQICALYPTFLQKDFAGKLAGLPSILSQQILAASGFNSIDVVQL